MTTAGAPGRPVSPPGPAGRDSSNGAADPIADAVQAVLEALERHDGTAAGPAADPLATRSASAAERAEIAAAVATARHLRHADLPAFPADRRQSLRDDLVRLEAAAGAAVASRALKRRLARGVGMAGALALALAGLSGALDTAGDAPRHAWPWDNPTESEGVGARIGPAAPAGPPKSATAIPRSALPALRSVGPTHAGTGIEAVARVAPPRIDPSPARTPVAPRPLAVVVDAAAASATPSAAPTSALLSTPVGHRDGRTASPRPTSTSRPVAGTETPTVAPTATEAAARPSIAPTAGVTATVATSGIVGRVTDMRGSGLEAALVKAESVDGAGRTVWVRSAADGSYRLDVPQGAYRVSAELDRFVTRWYADRARAEDADPVAVAADRLSEAIDFRLPEQGAVP